MAEEDEGSRPAGIGDATVKARTGKHWSEWFAILDEAHAEKLGHKGFVALLSENRRVGPWWRQMIAVAYEQERGLRERHQTPEGFRVSVSRTIAAPVKSVFGAWADDQARARWVKGADLTIRRSTPHRSIRLTWGDGTSSVDVHIYARGSERSQVVVDHTKLGGADDVARMKAFWSKALDALKRIVEE